MEVLSDVLRGLRTNGSVYFCDFLAPPWELSHRDEPRAMFHVVRRGRCMLSVDDVELELAPGDFAFLAPGVDHVVRHVNATDSPALLLCGYCQFDLDGGDALIPALPRHIVLQKHELDRWPWLTRTLEHLSAEYMSSAPGSELTVNKLTEVLLVQLLRCDFGRSQPMGIVAALRDKRLSVALQQIHENPGGDWTLEAAASAASMSRSGFARRFADVLQMRYFDYLTRLRMRNARELLESTRLPVAEIGERVGYRSEPSFVKAFKKSSGMTPRAFRLQGNSS